MVLDQRISMVQSVPKINNIPIPIGRFVLVSRVVICVVYTILYRCMCVIELFVRNLGE